MTHAHTKLDSGSGDRSNFDKTLHKVFAGRGSGLPCAHCHESITAAEIEYEVIEPGDATGSEAQPPTSRFHLRCYESWRAGSEL